RCCSPRTRSSSARSTTRTPPSVLRSLVTVSRMASPTEALAPERSRNGSTATVGTAADAVVAKSTRPRARDENRRRIAKDCIRSPRHDLLAHRGWGLRNAADARLGRARQPGARGGSGGRHGGVEPEGARRGRAAGRGDRPGASAGGRDARDGVRRRRISRVPDAGRGAGGGGAGASARGRAAAGGERRTGAAARADEPERLHERQARGARGAVDARRARHGAAADDAAQERVMAAGYSG